MSFSLGFPRASKHSPSNGILKQSIEDFVVEEVFAPELANSGEHVWLWLEKRGQNTEYVAEQLAKFAKVKAMDIGFAGLKDRWAVTRQWFSIYLGSKVEPAWAALELEGVTILQVTRHQKKLRRGEHVGNAFEIVVRDLQASSGLEEDLALIARRGFPNYFGIQRFGMGGANLERGERFFKGQIKASKSQRSFYLSAARSYLFNLNLARELQQGSWCENAIGGPLYGDEKPGINELSAEERALLEAYPVFADAFYKNRLTLERRPYAIIPKNLSWHSDADVLTLKFTLPPGCYATSLIAEFMEFKLGLGETHSDDA